jgi:hypothetical protein
VTGLDLVIATLAVYRISHLITLEEGPFGVVAWLRGQIDANQFHWTGRGVRCVLCVSFWLAGLLALWLGWSWLDWLGIAGGVALAHRAVNR